MPEEITIGKFTFATNTETKSIVLLLNSNNGNKVVARVTGRDAVSIQVASSGIFENTIKEFAPEFWDMLVRQGEFKDNNKIINRSEAHAN